MIGEDNGDPIVEMKFKPESETLASVFVNEDGSITFQAAGVSHEADDEDDDAGYFPSYVEIWTRTSSSMVPTPC